MKINVGRIKMKKTFLIVGIAVLVLGAGVYLYAQKSTNAGKPTQNDFEVNGEYGRVEISMDHHVYQDYKELFASADSVISGKVLSYKDEVINLVMSEKDIDLMEKYTEEQKKELKKSSTAPEYFPTRIFELEITEEFKGTYKVGDIIEVKQIYGEFNKEFYDNKALMDKDKSYLLFTEEYPFSPSSLLSDDQAAYILDNQLNEDEYLQPLLKTENSLELTEKDLRNLAKDN